MYDLTSEQKNNIKIFLQELNTILIEYSIRLDSPVGITHLTHGFLGELEQSNDSNSLALVDPDTFEEHLSTEDE